MKLKPYQYMILVHPPEGSANELEKTIILETDFVAAKDEANARLMAMRSSILLGYENKLDRVEVLVRPF